MNKIRPSYLHGSRLISLVLAVSLLSPSFLAPAPGKARAAPGETFEEVGAATYGGSRVLAKSFAQKASAPPQSQASAGIQAPNDTTLAWNMLALALQNTGAGKVVATSSFLDSSPGWTNITGTGAGMITGNPLVLRLDPWDPANKALVLTADGLWSTSNLRNSPPTWMQVLSLAQMRTAIEYDEAVFKEAMMLSTAAKGYVGIVVSREDVGNALTELWFGRTSDYTAIPVVWTWELVQTGPLTPRLNTTTANVGVFVSQHTTQRIWVTANYYWYDANWRIPIWYSSDGGANFTFYRTDPPAEKGNAVLFIPYSSNDTMLYIGVNGPGGGSAQPAVMKNTSGPVPENANWIDITPTISGNRQGPESKESFFQSPSTAGSALYMMGMNGALLTDSGLFKYDGSAWTTIQSSVSSDFPWGGSGFGGWPHDNNWLQVHNAGFGTGKIGRSTNGGVTWEERTGNLQDPGVAPNTVNVKYLTPGVMPLPDRFLYNLAQAKGGLPGDDRNCGMACSLLEAMYLAGDPINTKTGGVDYTTVDLSFPALGGQMAFQRSYSSLTTSLYTAPLGFGWTHNHDTRLILSTDPGGVPGQILFKPHGGNQLIFYDNGNQTYTPYPGVLADLVRTTSPLGYRVTSADQSVYTFDDARRLTSWADAQGNSGRTPTMARTGST